jgi:fucose permease
LPAWKAAVGAEFSAPYTCLAAVVVPVMAMVTMVRLSKCGSADEHNHGEEQCLFHEGIIAIKRVPRWHTFVASD